MHLEVEGYAISVLEGNLHLPLYYNSVVLPFPASEAGSWALLQEHCIWLGSGTSGQLYPLGGGDKEPSQHCCLPYPFPIP